MNYAEADGKYNYCDRLKMTKYEMAVRVCKILGIGNVANIVPITDKPSVIRPHNCFMEDERLTSNGMRPEVNFEQHIIDAWKGEPDL